MRSSTEANGEWQPLLYLDNAATSQKPQPVIDALVHYYSSMNANVHRGAHQLSASATQAYETVRTQVAKFINAPSAKNIIFVKGATEGINCVAESFVAQQCQAGDEVIISILEHLPTLCLGSVWLNVMALF